MTARALKQIARPVLWTLIVLPSLLLTTPGAAQQAIDPRFGLVNAFEAPLAASQSGAGWELIEIRWDQLQPDGPADWRASPEVDAWLEKARVAGREVVAVLIGTPAWATDGQPGDGVPRGLDLGANDPGNLWASFVRQVASYYGARGINRWVIWKHPNIPAGTPGALWQGSIEDYYRLVKTAYQAAKEANPNASIHLGGISERDPAWFGRFLTVAVNDPTAAQNNYYFDVVTVHVYYSTERVYTMGANPFYLMSAAGIPLKPVWINEVNARPAIDPTAYPPDAVFNRHPNISLEQQAAFIIQSFALGLSAGVERMAVYRLVDNLTQDGQEAFGLLRADGSPRPAYDAYKLAVEQFSGFVFARRVDEEAHPLIEYVRLTFAGKVTHVVWTRTEQTATLIIPARSQQATLINMYGARMIVTPEDGFNYRVVVPGAECNDPAEGCLIGGAPWMLVEEGVENALSEVPPSVAVQEGGTVPEINPTPQITPTPELLQPTPLSEPTEGTLPPNNESIVPTPVPEVAEAASQGDEAVSVPQPEVRQNTAMQLPALATILPYGLIGLGVLVIGGGVGYFLAGRGPGLPITREHEPLSLEGDAHLLPTQEHKRPDVDAEWSDSQDQDDNPTWAP